MKSRIIFITISFCFLKVFVFGQNQNKTVMSNTAFAIELYKKLFTSDTNVFISPYSISSALAMTYAGAKGETEIQMRKTLHYDLDQINTHKGFSELNSIFKKLNNDSTIKLSIANALWKSEGWYFKKDYLELTKKYYSAAIFPLNGAKPINDWADKNTNGKIKEIVMESDLANARLVLTNAIYFKGEWLNGFNAENTRRDKFTTLGKQEIDVDMMFQVNETNYFEDSQNQVIELPYKNGTMSMTFILPKANYSIEDLNQSINSESFANYNSKLSKRKVRIYIPKFSFTSEFHLEDVLLKMGMPDAFDPTKANFTGMSDGLSISKVIHKTFIEVNERGSEAAAVTAVIMIEKTLKPDVIEFKANRPFMIFIKDKETGTILFMGSIVKLL